MRATLLFICCITAQFLSMVASAGEVPVIAAVTATGPLHEYDDAPATPDADDPAIWLHPADRSKSLIIAAIKDAGLIVYNLDGDFVQAIPPPNLPTILPEDPPTPAGINLDAPDPCPESQEGDTFGRYNNVDVAYGVRLGYGPLAPRVDHAGDRVLCYPGGGHYLIFYSSFFTRFSITRLLRVHRFPDATSEFGPEENGRNVF